MKLEALPQKINNFWQNTYNCTKSNLNKTKHFDRQITHCYSIQGIWPTKDIPENSYSESVDIKHFKGNFYSLKKHFLCIENATIRVLVDKIIDKRNSYSLIISCQINSWLCHLLISQLIINS